MSTVASQTYRFVDNRGARPFTPRHFTSARFFAKSSRARTCTHSHVRGSFPWAFHPRTIDSRIALALHPSASVCWKSDARTFIPGHFRRRDDRAIFLRGLRVKSENSFHRVPLNLRLLYISPLRLSLQVYWWLTKILFKIANLSGTRKYSVGSKTIAPIFQWIRADT